MGATAAHCRLIKSMSQYHPEPQPFLPQIFSQNCQQGELKKSCCISSVKTWTSLETPRKGYSNHLFRILHHFYLYLLKPPFSVTVQAQTYKQVAVGWQVIMHLNTHCLWQMWDNTCWFIQQWKSAWSNGNCSAFAIGQEDAMDRDRSQMCGRVITSTSR